MKTFKQLENYGEYSNGQADILTKLLAIKGDELPAEVKQWVYDERLKCREQAVQAYTNAIKVLKENN